MEPVRAPFLTYRDVAAVADEFLVRYNLSEEIPVNIEAIVEFDLGLQLTPIPGLKSRLGVDGHIGLGLNEMIVDSDVMRRHRNRYRFTLAHEVGHLKLHADALRSMPVKNVEDWLRFYLDLDGWHQGWFERQAHWFAGAVLVPEVDLVTQFRAAFDRLGSEIDDPGALSYKSRSTIAGSIAKVFHVSTSVMERRFRETGLW